MKKRIVDKYKDRIFWIPWGTMTVSYEEIMNAKTCYEQVLNMISDS